MLCLKHTTNCFRSCCCD